MKRRTAKKRNKLLEIGNEGSRLNYSFACSPTPEKIILKPVSFQDTIKQDNTPYFNV
jgi:hypothetical protein